MKALLTLSKSVIKETQKKVENFQLTKREKKKYDFHASGLITFTSTSQMRTKNINKK